MWRRLQEIQGEEGRDPAAFPTMEYHNVNINEDKQAALDESKKFLDNYYGPVFNEPMVASRTAAGSPEECAEHLRELRDAGAKEIALRITSWDQERQYQRLVNEVLPLVNG
jgi:alkanesulfonate monooxygenase SsuD/methylene tetrahydromethanopterin reductase-like flavin-dependent oxidoreductase (luciferase family)